MIDELIKSYTNLNTHERLVTWWIGISLVLWMFFFIQDINTDHSGHDHKMVYSETCYGDGPCIDNSHRVCLID